MSNSKNVKYKFPKITIITSTLNCAAALKRTAKSIRNQVYKNIEWIIADGQSIDETVSVIQENSDIISFWLSETDNGIYEAWNKACKLINGEWVIFLGAGDTFESDLTLLNCAKTISKVPDEYNFVFGGLKIKKQEKYLEIYLNGNFIPIWMDLNLTTPSHSSTFCRSKILKTNHFDESFKIIADKKFMLSYSKNMYFNLQQFVTIMDEFGESHKISNIPVIWKENRILSKDGPNPPLMHVVKAFIINYKNLLLLYIMGTKNYEKWIKNY
jgi:glycosyltransferase involved in cell wall biosynthesis